MKHLLVIFILLTGSYYLSAQTWTSSQLLKANTAKDVSNISEVEKDAIMYINLARLYPKDFAKFEVKDYFGTVEYGDYLKDSEYRQSLIETLNTMEPVGLLYFDNGCYTSARCLAKEQAASGEMGHKRKNCVKENYAECCSYGMSTGKDIAMQWLIDDGVSSLGHRSICLDA